MKAIKKAKAKAATVAVKARRYMIISSVVLNVLAALAVIGAPYLADTGIAHAANLPGAGLHLQQVAYLSQAIPSSQLHQMPIEEVAYHQIPLPGRKPHQVSQ